VSIPEFESYDPSHTGVSFRVHRLMGAMGEICDNVIEHSQAALLLF
jgi:hypothetical protein